MTVIPARTDARSLVDCRAILVSLVLLVVTACGGAPRGGESPRPDPPASTDIEVSPAQAAWLAHARREALYGVALWQLHYCSSRQYLELMVEAHTRGSGRKAPSEASPADIRADLCPLGVPAHTDPPLSDDDYVERVMADADALVARLARPSDGEPLASAVERVAGPVAVAWLHVLRGDFDRAAEIQQRQGQPLHRVHPEDGSEADWIPEWVWLYWSLGQDELALRFLQAAADGSSFRPSVYRPADPRMMGTYLVRREAEQRAAWSLSELPVAFASARMPDDPRAVRLGYESVLRRKGRSLDVARADRAVWQRRRRDDAATEAALARLATVYAALSAHELTGPEPYWLPNPPSKGAGLPIKYRHQRRHQNTGCLMTGANCDHPEYLYELDRAELFEAIDEVEYELTERHARAPSSPEPTLDEIQRRLPADAALIEYVRYRPFHPPVPKPAVWPPPAAGTAGSIIVAADEPWGPERYAAFVVPPRGAPRVVELGEAQAVDDAIVRFRESLTASHADTRSLGEQLHGLLLAPLLPAIGDASHLFLAPDGQISLVPFAALVDRDTRQYAVERFLLTYLDSGRDLLRAPGPRTDAPPLLVFDPAFKPDPPAPATPATPAPAPIPTGRVAPTRNAGLPYRHKHQGAFVDAVDYACKRPLYPGWDQLDRTRAEAGELRRLLPGARELSGASATEAAVKRVTGPRILHLATHGGFLPNLQCVWQSDVDRSGAAALAARLSSSRGGDHGAPSMPVPPLRARVLEDRSLAVLALAGAGRQPNPKGEDGLLTALEISAMDLVGTELVVLSACDTGLGTSALGEGVAGLRRAFAVAGAETLVTSLWVVDDSLVVAVMANYYERLMAGAGRSVAMREVQLDLLADPATSHPKAWASFVVSGDPGPLR